MSNDYIILLNKDHSVDYVKESKFKYNKDIKHLLIPMTTFDTNTFIPVKCNKYMKFDKAIIEVQLVYNYLDYSNEYDIYNSNIVYTKKEFTSIIDLYNFINSIDKLYYINELLNLNYGTELLSSIDICSYNISLYKNGKCTYHSSDSYDTEGGVGYYTIRKAMSNISDLYNNFMKYSTDNMIYINDKSWKITDKCIGNGIYGLHFELVNSIYFITPEVFDFTNEISQIKFFHYIINLDDTALLNELKIREKLEDGDVDYYTDISFSVSNLKYIFEKIIYFKFFYTCVLMIYNDIIFNVNPHHDKGFDIWSLLSFKYYNGHNRDMFFTKDNIPSIYDVMKFVYKK